MIKRGFPIVFVFCTVIFSNLEAALIDRDPNKNFKPMLHYGVGSKGEWRLYIRDPELRSSIGRKIIPANEWCSLVDQPYSARLQTGLTQFARLHDFNFVEFIGALLIHGYSPRLKNGRITNPVVMAGLFALGAKSVGEKARAQWQRDFAMAELAVLLDQGRLGFPKDREAANCLWKKTIYSKDQKIRDLSRYNLWIHASAGVGAQCPKGTIEDMLNQRCVKDPETPEASESLIIRSLKTAALKGGISAQRDLFEIYKNGLEGMPQDFKEALRWVRMGAENDDPEAQANLGTMLAIGLGTPVNYKEALKWTRLAALKGYAAAQSNLGVIYLEGHGVKQNLNRAAKWFHKAEAQGNLIARRELGRVYLAKGRRLRKSNYDCHNTKACLKAYRLYRKAAEYKNTVAMVFLGAVILTLDAISRKQREAGPDKKVKAIMWWVLANRIGLEHPSMDKDVKTFLEGAQKPGVIKKANVLADQCMRKGLKGC